MKPIKLKVLSYDIGSNHFTAITEDDCYVTFDPFVGCAVDMPDEGYAKGGGYRLVGKKYLISDYTSYGNFDTGDISEVVPYAGGIVEIGEEL